LRKLRHKQARFRRNADHILSKQIVASAEPGATIVLEDLTNIRRRARKRRKTETQRRIHAWSFAQLTERLRREDALLAKLLGSTGSKSG
jgi:putative transposase